MSPKTILPSRGVSIAHVAQLARVGIGTASRALSGDGYVSEKASRTVREAAKKLGYRKNQHARALRAGSIPSAVFLCCNRSVSGTFHGAMLDAAAVRLDAMGWQTVLVRWDTGPDPQEAPKILERIGMDVMILAGVMTSPRIVSCCLQAGAPIVLCNLGLEPPGVRVPCDLVKVDEFEAFRMGLAHLLKLGHSKIGIVTDGAYPWSVRELDWWKQECRRRRILFLAPPITPVQGPGEYPQVGFLAAGHHLDGRDRPTALMVTDDLMLFGVSRACSARGVQVPRDLSVLGRGGYPFLNFPGNPWSIVSLTPEKIGFALADLAVWRREHSSSRPKAIEIPPVIVDHGSVAHPRS